jgi:hypothetical protein
MFFRLAGGKQFDESTKIARGRVRCAEYDGRRGSTPKEWYGERARWPGGVSIVLSRRVPPAVCFVQAAPSRGAGLYIIAFVQLNIDESIGPDAVLLGGPADGSLIDTF